MLTGEQVVSREREFSEPPGRGIQQRELSHFLHSYLFEFTTEFGAVSLKGITHRGV